MWRNSFFSGELVRFEEAWSAVVVNEFILKPLNKPFWCLMFWVQIFVLLPSRWILYVELTERYKLSALNLHKTGNSHEIRLLNSCHDERMASSKRYFCLFEASKYTCKLRSLHSPLARHQQSTIAWKGFTGTVERVKAFLVHANTIQPCSTLHLWWHLNQNWNRKNKKTFNI